MEQLNNLIFILPEVVDTLKLTKGFIVVWLKACFCFGGSSLKGGGGAGVSSVKYSGGTAGLSTIFVTGNAIEDGMNWGLATYCGGIAGGSYAVYCIVGCGGPA